jgi:hypothetical protein
MFRRLFCCCVPLKTDADDYKCLIDRSVQKDSPSTGVPSTGVPSFTCPLVQVHVTTTKGDAPHICCRSAQCSVDDRPKKEVKASAPAIIDYDTQPYCSQLQWGAFSDDMQTQEKGRLF